LTSRHTAFKPYFSGTAYSEGGCGHHLRTRVALAKEQRRSLCCGVYILFENVEQNNLPCLWGNAPLLPTYKKRKVKGEVYSIDYHMMPLSLTFPPSIATVWKRRSS
jgi:hypothetical protein